MDPYLLEAFQREVRAQCEALLVASAEIDEWLDADREHERLAEQRRDETQAAMHAPGVDPWKARDLVSVYWATRDPSLNGAVDQRSLWAAVQALLVAAGNLSKLLFADNKKVVQRHPLRKSLDVGDQSVFRLGGEIRRCRNMYEHFDECLEQWASRRPRFMVDHFVGQFRITGTVPQTAYLRGFDSDAYAVMLFGVAYELRPVIEETKTILERATAALEGGQAQPIQ